MAESLALVSEAFFDFFFSSFLSEIIFKIGNYT